MWIRHKYYVKVGWNTEFTVYDSKTGTDDGFTYFHISIFTKYTVISALNCHFTAAL